jgi:hypothetical protein
LQLPKSYFDLFNYDCIYNEKFELIENIADEQLIRLDYKFWKLVQIYAMERLKA